MLVILGLLLTFSGGCHSDDTDSKQFEELRDTKTMKHHPLTEEEIRALPPTMTARELFEELWTVDLPDPPMLFYPSAVEDHVYVACPDPADGEALARGDYANVRIRSIFHFRFVMPTKLYEPAIWGDDSFKEPWLPTSNPFDSVSEK